MTIKLRLTWEKVLSVFHFLGAISCLLYASSLCFKTICAWAVCHFSTRAHVSVWELYRNCTKQTQGRWVGCLGYFRRWYAGSFETYWRGKLRVLILRVKFRTSWHKDLLVEVAIVCKLFLFVHLKCGRRFQHANVLDASTGNISQSLEAEPRECWSCWKVNRLTQLGQKRKDDSNFQPCLTIS